MAKRFWKINEIVLNSEEGMQKRWWKHLQINTISLVRAYIKFFTLVTVAALQNYLIISWLLVTT
ncbi:MAG: hypothetical protein J5932_00060 [Prevotella sp.]|nr:hypothetical protein [Prevotella sp.]